MVLLHSAPLLIKLATKCGNNRPHGPFPPSSPTRSPTWRGKQLQQAADGTKHRPRCRVSTSVPHNINISVSTLITSGFVQSQILYSPRCFSLSSVAGKLTLALGGRHAHQCATYKSHKRVTSGRSGSGWGLQQPGSGSVVEKPINRYDFGLHCFFFFPSSSLHPFWGFFLLLVWGAEPTITKWMKNFQVPRVCVHSQYLTTDHRADLYVTGPFICKCTFSPQNDHLGYMFGFLLHC